MRDIEPIHIVAILMLVTVLVGLCLDLYWEVSSQYLLEQEVRQKVNDGYSIVVNNHKVTHLPDLDKYDVTYNFVTNEIYLDTKGTSR